MKYILLLGFAATFTGADCGSANGLTSTCPGSNVSKATYRVVQGCGGDNGVITLSIGAADSCSIAVLEPTGVGLPAAGAFNDLAPRTNYQLAQGNWNLQNPPTNFVVAGNSLQCTAGTATSTGNIDLACKLIACGYQGEDTEVTCQTGNKCTIHLFPFTGDAGVTSPVDGSAG